jgi:hypothetical protein
MAQPSAPGDTQPLAPVDLLQEDREVSPEERARILKQIERVVAEGRIPVTSEAFSLRSRKSGILFPVLINLAAAVLVVAGILGLSYYFRTQRQTRALSHGTFQSAEGRLLETYQKQSESLLRAKEEQISLARERLRGVESTFAARLQAKEQELRQSMDAELAAERERLKAQGGADAEVERRLRELQAQRQAASAAELARYEKELELERLTAEREQERLFSDQIQGAYSLVLRDLQANDLPAASQGLLRLKALLSDPSLAIAPGPKDRRAVDLFLAEALAELVERRSRDAAGALASAGPAAAAASAAAAPAPPQPPASAAAVPAPSEQPASAADSELAQKLRRTERDLVERERQYQELSRQLRARSAEAEAAQAKNERAVEELRQKAERLSAQLEAGAEAQKELAQQARAAEDRGQRQGHEAALKEVMAFLDYLSQSSAQRKESQAPLLAQARQDPLYGAVIREIRILAAGSRLAGASTAGGYKLLGTVSSVGAGRVTVEKLVELSVKPGSRVQIRRVSDLESEQVIARGIVQQAGAGKITILLDSSAKGPQSPAVSDAVYVEAGAGE